MMTFAINNCACDSLPMLCWSISQGLNRVLTQYIEYMILEMAKNTGQIQYVETGKI
jgi:hypothetical protein